MRVAAIGRTRMLLETIKLLGEHGHRVCMVITCKARPGASALERDFASAAEEIGATFFESQRLDSPDSLSALANSKADVAVSIDWVSLLPRQVCEAFPHGILNLHAGDLPRYRGNSPIAWAILAGESRIGLTVHRMSPEGFDCGPILQKAYLEVLPATYMRQIFDFVESQGPQLLVDAVDQIDNGTARPVEQEETGLTVVRCYPRVAADGQIRWTDTAEHVVRLVRASSEPYEGAFTWHEGRTLRVWRSRWQAWSEPSLAVPGQCVFRHPPTGDVGIAAADAIVVLEEVQMDGGARVPAAQAIRSTRTRLGH